MHPNRTPNVTCFRCGKAFYRRPSLIKATNFCSRECRKTRITRDCLICGSSFTVVPANTRNGKGRFCSAACVNKWRSVSYRRPIAERFWEKVIKSPVPSECWQWTASKYKGYGTIGDPDRGTIFAHRVSWEIHYGPIPDGLHVLHTCDNPECTNPYHLFLGTNLDNIRDKVRKGRGVRGAMNPRSKLTEDQVLLILDRLSAGETRTSLAKEFGVGYNAIMRIDEGTRWSHVPRPSSRTAAG